MKKHDSEKLRGLMYDWHGGQGSSLYAAASSGLVADVETLAADLRHCAMLATHPDTSPFDPYNGTEATTEAATLKRFADSLPGMVGAAFRHPLDGRVYRPLPWAVIPGNAQPVEG